MSSAHVQCMQRTRVPRGSWGTYVEIPRTCPSPRLRSPVAVQFVLGAGSRLISLLFWFWHRGGSSPAKLVGSTGNRMREIPACGAPGGEGGAGASRSPVLRGEAWHRLPLGIVSNRDQLWGIEAAEFPIPGEIPRPCILPHGTPSRCALALVLCLSSTPCCSGQSLRLSITSTLSMRRRRRHRGGWYLDVSVGHGPTHPPRVREGGCSRIFGSDSRDIARFLGDCRIRLVPYGEFFRQPMVGG